MKQRYKVIASCYNKQGIHISTATNSYTKTHPLQKYFAEKVGHPHKIYLHAEIAAILAAKQTHIHSITITRFDKNGQLTNAKPCPICMEAIKAFGISNIKYSVSKGYEYVKR